MFKTMFLLVFLGVGVVSAQAPEKGTLVLSLKTMSKSLASCRESYTRKFPGSATPLVEEVIGKQDYEKDLESLDNSEKIVNVLIAHPERVTGRVLVAVLSASDDFSVGVGSSRAELLRHIVIDRSSSERQSELLVSAEDLNACQRSLFDAGDGFVEVVMGFVGAEDEAVAKMGSR